MRYNTFKSGNFEELLKEDDDNDEPDDSDSYNCSQSSESDEE